MQLPSQAPEVGIEPDTTTHEVVNQTTHRHLGRSALRHAAIFAAYTTYALAFIAGFKALPLSQAEGFSEAQTPTEMTSSDHPIVLNTSLEADPTNGSLDHPNDCTSIRRQAKGIYMGMACRSQNAVYQKINGGYPEKGWVYSAIQVDGIYKCGFLRDGVLRQASIRSDVVSKCSGYYDPLVKQRYVYFEDYNCGQLKSGLDSCKSGTDSSDLTKKCLDSKKDLKLSGNFATDDPTPLNVLGTGEGGFSMPLPNKIDDKVSYRVQIKQGSAEGKAIVVRDTNNTPYLDWGLLSDYCVSQDQRSGGTPTVVKHG